MVLLLNMRKTYQYISVEAVSFTTNIRVVKIIVDYNYYGAIINVFSFNFIAALKYFEQVEMN